MVDIHGCPIDADFDGVPNYTDSCPPHWSARRSTPPGALIDPDGDGIPDGLDDCPDSQGAKPVDRFGVSISRCSQNRLS